MTERTKITARDNGPYLVRGPVVVTDAEGNEYRPERETIALCRCGGSKTKPFCDGTPTRRSASGRRRGPSERRYGRNVKESGSFYGSCSRNLR
jgi:CDGSH iron-sulfur domain-containing protein 3